MIKSFIDRGTEDLYHGRNTSRFRSFPADIANSALCKLDVIDSAGDVQDLQVPSGNRLEALKGNFQGFYSLRVNDQYRIVFGWDDGVATDVSLADYH